MSTDLPAWSEEDGLLREAVRTLLGRYGRRYFLDCYRDGREPEALWRELCKAGYVGAAVPGHLGGGGSSLDAVVAVGEEMGAAGMPLLSFIMTELCLPVLARHALPETAARLVPPIIAGDRRLAFAITEPDAGTNSFAMRTTAIRSGPDYVVSGRKRWISSAGEADDLFLVCTDGDTPTREGRRAITILMVDLLPRRPHGGPHRRRRHPRTAIRRHFRRCPGARGEPRRRSGRRGRRVVRVAEHRAAADLRVRLRSRLSLHLTGGRLCPRPGPVRCPHRRLPVSAASAREVLGRVECGPRAQPRGRARRGAAGSARHGLANAAKWLASEAANQAADHAIQVHGGNGITDEYDLIPLWRTTRLLRFAPINNEMVLNQIGQHVLGLPRSY